MNLGLKNKTALITGISGQDGAYLSHFLLQKGYKVIGTTRNKSKKNLYRLKKLKIIKKIVLLKGEATNLKFCFISSNKTKKIVVKIHWNSYKTNKKIIQKKPEKNILTARIYFNNDIKIIYSVQIEIFVKKHHYL